MALGDSVHGNITRIDNALADLPNNLQAEKGQLENAGVQLENARAEVRKPFAQETELKIKEARLAQLNTELNLGRDESEAAGMEQEEEQEL